MEIILHIGMPKSGSSALQAGLHSVRRQLSDAGIVYPDGGHVGGNHPYLVHGCVPTERLPRQLLQAYGGDEQAIGEDGERWWRTVAEAVHTKQAHTLLLSEESLFKVSTEDGLASLRRRLDRLAASVRVVAYVRRPSDHYLSAVQQTIKASHHIAPPGPTSYRPTLEGYAAHVADEIAVVAYEPSAWPDRDIVRHFLTSFVPEGGSIGVPGPQQVNTSLSAEAMAVLHGYRHAIWPDDNSRFTPDTDRLVRALVIADAEVGGDFRPRLHEHLRREIDEKSIDLEWLKGEHGVCFEHVDYDRLGRAPAGGPPPRRIEEICPVDPDRLAEVTFQMIRQLADAAQPAESVRAVAEADEATGWPPAARLQAVAGRLRRAAAGGQDVRRRRS